MSEKQRIISELKNADISQDDWCDEILDTNIDLYARGYLSAAVSRLTDCMDSHSEGFREDLLNLCSYNIWGKK